jgi:transcriptional regulator with XRE-family HTH domain
VDWNLLGEDSTGMDKKYDEIIETFGMRVREMREEYGYSQEAFAQEAGIDRSYYGRIERGNANLTLKQIAAIAERLGISIPELFEPSTKIRRRKFKY